MKRILMASLAGMLTLGASAQTGRELPFQKWALTPPMGWNSWDCYGPTVVESEVKANADYMAAKLAAYGWEYVVVDIRWFVENDKAGGYNQTDPIYVYDEYGRYTPALNRFPSAANGVGFKALADYIHSKGLKFGIHLMRGLPKIAAEKKLPVKGTNGITCDMIASNDSACTWLRDNYKVDYRKPGAQEYYNSCFDLYAQWGVDYVKIDDLSRPYHQAEIEMIRRAIDQCGRPMVLSLSPGETPIERMDHVKSHANMWRTVDDFWDNWSQLSYQFQVCAKWAPYIAPGTWPDADMLPLGKISIRGERGSERWTNFTTDEQYTMMNLWTIFKSPLMFGGDLPQNDDATNALLTNRAVLDMHHYSAANRQLSRTDNRIVWTADDPATGDKYAALFNIGGSAFVNPKNVLWRSGTISYLTTGYAVDVDVALPEGCRTLALVATDGGDGYDCDHADWIRPIVTLKDGTTVQLTSQKYLRGTCGWGSVSVNKNLNGGSLSIDGTTYDDGFAVHANSILLFDLPAEATRFTAYAGIDNTGTDQGSRSSVEFMVFDEDATLREETTDQWAGGNVTIKVDPLKQSACSGYLSKASGRQQATVEADITGAEKLYLVVTNGGDGLSYDHADWAQPVLVDAQGNEVSLTTIDWDANPVNGWNAPRKNTNNDGGTLSIGGTTYAQGFGVNAPSMLVFTLPQGHDFVRFKSTVGYDDDVTSAPSGVSMEFRVFTQDPTPDTQEQVPLDLTALGYAADQECTITEMWNGTSMGVFKNAEFAPMLEAHASGLYRVAAVDRAAGASVEVSTSETEYTTSDVFPITITVSGGAYEGAYIQLLCNNAVVGTLPVEADGTATYQCSGWYAGTYTLEARYSGTTSVASAQSSPLQITITGVAEDLTELRNRLQTLVTEGQAIDPTTVAGEARAPLAQALADAKPVEEKSKEELESAIATLQQAMDAARLTMSAMKSLQEAVVTATAFAQQLVPGAAQVNLNQAIEKAQAVYDSATSTTLQVTDAAASLLKQVETAKLEAQPAPGTCFDMTSFLVNPSFEQKTSGWSTDNEVSGWAAFDTWTDRPADDGSAFVSLCYQNITSIDLYQTISGLPAGVYTLEGALRNTDGLSAISNQHLYAEVNGKEYVSEALQQVGGENNNNWYAFKVTDIKLVTGDALRVGVRSTGQGSGTKGWFQADNFRLYYWGTDVTAITSPRAASDVQLQVLQGGLKVNAASEGMLSVYSLGGVLTRSVPLVPGTQWVGLQPGTYIVCGQVVLIRP